MAATATKTTKAPAAAPAAKGTKGTDALAAARAARERAAENDVFKPGTGAKEGTKALPPQAQQIANIVQSHKKSGVTRSALVSEMEGVVKTKQPLGRILSYYQKRLVDEGHVVIVEAPSKAAAPKAAKAAAAPADDEEEEDGEE